MGSSCIIRSQFNLMEPNTLQTMLHMNAADAKASYAHNSLLQRNVMSRAKPVVQDAIRGLFTSISYAGQQCLRAADLGCSSGPNTLLMVSVILDEVHTLLRQTREEEKPEFLVFLNDLPGNDFNAIFRSLPSFHEKLKKEEYGQTFVVGVAGSFYERLFPMGTLHFVHSSYSLHWLSKVPEELKRCRNKGNIYITSTSPPSVTKAYVEQFQKDFALFLSLRSQEMTPRGRMVLSFQGRSTASPVCVDCCGVWELLAKSLMNLVAEGLVGEDEVDSLDLPFYAPYEEEVKAIVEKEGSFKLDVLETYEAHWGPAHDDTSPFDPARSGWDVSRGIRAVVEPMLKAHFRSLNADVLDRLFQIYSRHVTQHLSLRGMTKYTNIIISLTKK